MSHLLLEVWREIGHSPGIPEAVHSLAQIIARSVPLSGIEVLRVGPGRAALETAGAFSADGEAVPRRTALGDGPSAPLLDWIAREDVIAVPAGGPWPDNAAALAEAYRNRDVLLGALRDRAAGRVEGVVVLLAEAGAYKSRHARLLREILEPLSVALENDTRQRELSALRAAAAERQVLLARLGRDRAGEAIVGNE